MTMLTRVAISSAVNSRNVPAKLFDELVCARIHHLHFVSRSTCAVKA